MGGFPPTDLTIRLTALPVAPYGGAVDKQPSMVADVSPPAVRVPGAGESLTDVAITATIVAGLLDAAPDGLLLVDATGRIMLVNTRVEELFGYTRTEMLSAPVEMLLPQAFRDVHVAHRQRFLEQPRTRPMGAGLSLSGRRRDGSEFPVEVSLSPLSTADAQWVVAGIRDATERIEIERQRRDSAIVDEQARIAEDLADTVIRGLFGTGLHLQGLLDVADNHVRPGLEAAVESIDETIRAVRTAIFGLRPERKV
jgi:PAS domain S-box-containing protein